MERIVLHGPTLDRRGRYRDAGATLAVGGGGDHAPGDDEAEAADWDISAERAGELVANAGAIDPDAPVPSAPDGPPAGPTRDPLDHDGDGRKGGSLPRARRSN